MNIVSSTLLLFLMLNTYQSPKTETLKEEFNGNFSVSVIKWEWTENRPFHQAKSGTDVILHWNDTQNITNININDDGIKLRTSYYSNNGECAGFIKPVDYFYIDNPKKSHDLISERIKSALYECGIDDNKIRLLKTEWTEGYTEFVESFETFTKNSHNIFSNLNNRCLALHKGHLGMCVNYSKKIK